MRHEELKVIGKELGIKDADSLPYNDLKKKVAQLRKAKGDPQEETTPEAGKNPLDTVLEELKLPEEKTPLIAFDQGAIGIEKEPDLEQSSEEDLLEAEDSLEAEFPLEDEAPIDSYQDSSGRIYGFTENAPAKFRFNNLVKTQEEWLTDQDAMEQLALGNCSFVEQKF